MDAEVPKQKIFDRLEGGAGDPSVIPADRDMGADHLANQPGGYCLAHIGEMRRPTAILVDRKFDPEAFGLLDERVAGRKILDERLLRQNVLAGGKGKPAEVHFTPAVVEGPTGDKIRKALDTPFKPGAGPQLISGRKVVDLLRHHAKGINILDNQRSVDITEVPYQFTEPIPLGAFFQWAEDRFGWRFIIREYGIVVTDRDQMPPGALPLLDFWRQGKSTVGPIVAPAAK